MSRDPSAEYPRDAGMRCARAQRLLWDLVDGALPPEREQAVRRHLERCSVCRHEWEACLQAEHVLASAPSHIPPPGDLRSGFYARLAAQSMPARSGLLALTVTRAVLPVLAVCLLLVVFFKAQFAPSAAPPDGPPFKGGQAGDNRASVTDLSPEMQSRLAEVMTPSSHINASVRPQSGHDSVEAFRAVRVTGRHQPYSRRAMGPLPRVAVTPNRDGLRLAANQSQPAPGRVKSKLKAQDLTSMLPSDPRNSTAASGTEAGNGTASPTELATAAMAATSGEQEVHVVDEERGFTRSVRVIAAADVNDENVNEATPVVSVEADTAQN